MPVGAVTSAVGGVTGVKDEAGDHGDHCPSTFSRVRTCQDRSSPAVNRPAGIVTPDVADRFVVAWATSAEVEADQYSHSPSPASTRHW